MNTRVSISEISELKPRWLRITAAVKYSGLSRTQIYDLIKQGKLRSFAHKAHPEARAGIRFVSIEAIDAYLDACASTAGIQAP